MSVKKSIVIPPRASSALGFEHVNRYWDRAHNAYAAKILPGEYYVTDLDELIVTVLGSCISACIRDPVCGVGGMNHFLLPDTRRDEVWGKTGVNSATRYGAYAMEHLINALLKLGANRGNLEVKMVGGGRVLNSLSEVGKRNIEFARDYLGKEGLRIAGEDVGDVYPRKVYYNPKTGKVRVRKLRRYHNHTIEQREQDYRRQIETRIPDGNVELF